MENYELIQDFIDGTLDPNKEQEFFAMLGTNEDARNELKSQLAIRDAVRADVAAFTPSAKSTIAIFSQLGFQAPVPTPLSPAKSLFVKSADFMARFKQALWGSLTTAAVATAVFFLINNPKDKLDNINSLNTNKTTNSKIPVVSSSASVDKIEKLNTSNSNKSSQPKVIYKYVIVGADKFAEKQSESNAQSNSNNLPANENNESNDNIASKEISPVSTNSLAQNDSKKIKLVQTEPIRISKNEFVQIVPVNNQEELSKMMKNDNPVGLFVELSGAQYWMDKTDIKPKNEQAFNNTSITAMYGLSEELQLGIEYRRENFYQKFEGTDYYITAERGDKILGVVEYEQRPNFETAGLVFRYLPDFAKMFSIRPFSQLGFGFNNAGFVTRGMLGLQYQAYSNYGITIGYDYSNLTFQHQGNWFNTGKSGLQIGAIVKF